MQSDMEEDGKKTTCALDIQPSTLMIIVQWKRQCLDQMRKENQNWLFLFSATPQNTLFIFYRQSLLSRKKKNEGVKKRSLTSNLQHTTNLACVMIFFLSLLIYHYLLLNILHLPHLIHHPHLFYHFFLLSKLSKAKQH